MQHSIPLQLASMTEEEQWLAICTGVRGAAAKHLECMLLVLIDENDMGQVCVFDDDDEYQVACTSQGIADDKMKEYWKNYRAWRKCGFSLDHTPFSVQRVSKPKAPDPDRVPPSSE